MVSVSAMARNRPPAHRLANTVGVNCGLLQMQPGTEPLMIQLRTFMSEGWLTAITVA